uniref:L-dopachrome isomerase n=1 Tax=Timema monikensis TaxID=170555 RepID=A0A7R9EKI3_9NEOP|nr:unnamed protein product [Timema monikensis]
MSPQLNFQDRSLIFTDFTNAESPYGVGRSLIFTDFTNVESPYGVGRSLIFTDFTNAESPYGVGRSLIFTDFTNAESPYGVGRSLIFTDFTNAESPYGVGRSLIFTDFTNAESPYGYCMAEVIPDVLLSWKGSTAPAGNAMLLCIGLMGPEDNQRHAAVLSEHLFNHLGIPKDRLLIEFNDIKDSDVGFNGTTVDALGLFKK